MFGFYRCLNTFRVLWKLNNRICTKNVKVIPCFKYSNRKYLANYQLLNVITLREFTQTSLHESNLEKTIVKIEYFSPRFGRIIKKNVDQLLEGLKESTSISHSQSLTAIKCCGKLLIDTLPDKRNQIVRDVWKELLRMKCDVSIEHYNALLKVFIENDYVFNEAEYLNAIKDSELEPNHTTYELLLENRVRAGDIIGGLEMLSIMQAKSVPISTTVINALILGYGDKGDIEKAEDQLTQMSTMGLKQNSQTYAALLCAYAKYGDITSIVYKIECCKLNGNPILAEHYLEVIQQLCMNGYTQYIDSLLKEISENHELKEDINNLVMQLVLYGLDDAAYQVLTSKSLVYPIELTLIERGLHFLSQLIKMKRPMDYILNYTQRLANFGMGFHAHFGLVKEIAENGSRADVLSILQELKNNNNIDVNLGYFAHLFPASEADTFELLRIIYDEFHICVNVQFMREHVLPSHQFRNPTETVQLLKNAHVSDFIAATSVMFECLRQNRIQDATDVMLFYKPFLKPETFSSELISALTSSKHFDNFAQFLYVYITKVIEADRMEMTSTSQTNDILGSILYDALSSFDLDERADAAEPILAAFLTQNLRISKVYADHIREMFCSNISEQINVLLDGITDGLQLFKIENSIPSENKRITELKSALIIQKVDLIRLAYHKLQRIEDHLSLRMNIALLNLFQKADKLTETKQITLKLLQTNELLIVPDLPTVLHKFSIHGDIKSIEEIGNYLSDDQKYNFAFNAKLDRAYSAAGKLPDLIEIISRKLDKAITEQQITRLSKSISLYKLRDMLQRRPDLIGKLEILAEKCATKNILSPYNALFCHFFIEKNTQEYQKIWNDHIKSYANFDYRPILQAAKQKSDVSLMVNLIALLKTSNNHKSRLIFPYNKLLEIYIDNDMIDDALDTLKDAQQIGIINSINTEPLREIQKAAIALGKKFPYDISHKQLRPNFLDKIDD